MGTPPLDHFLRGVRLVFGPGMGFRAGNSASHRGRISDAIHGARRVGRCAGASKRNLARGFPRDFSRLRLSAR